MDKTIQQRTATIASLPGDGIGPEVTREALKVLHAAADREGLRLIVDERLVGGAALDETGSPLPHVTREVCLAADAVLLGAVGGPKWDDVEVDERPEKGLLALRRLLSAYANLRPVSIPKVLAAGSPLKQERITGVDMLIVRELTGGIYFGMPRACTDAEGYDTMRYTREEVERIARIAFQRARQRRGRVTSVDKANVLDTSRFWRKAVVSVHRDEFPDVELNHMYVDNAAMQLVRDPRAFDVILTGNLFGDILSDLAAALPGSLGLLPSASLGGRVGLFEPVHGSAPDIAGTDCANPLAAILSGMLLLEELGVHDAARVVREAVDAVLEAGYRTPDLQQQGTRVVGTAEMGSLIAEAVSKADVPAEVPSS